MPAVIDSITGETSSEAKARHGRVLRRNRRNPMTLEKLQELGSVTAEIARTNYMTWFRSPSWLRKLCQRKCCGSKNIIVRWMCVRWEGLPYPKRVWRRWFTKDHTLVSSHEGCGCSVKFKAVFCGLVSLIQVVKKA